MPVAQLENYKGLLFATFDPEAAPLRDYLGEMAWYLDCFFDRREGGIEVLAVHKWVMPGNWKFPAENLGGDAYHVRVEPPFGRGDRVQPRAHRRRAALNNRMVLPGNGHMLVCIGPDDIRRPALSRAPRL